MSWRTRWRVNEYVRNSLWIVPAILAALAIGMGIVFPELDEEANLTI